MKKIDNMLYCLAFTIFLLPSVNLFLFYSHGLAKIISAYLLFRNIIYSSKKHRFNNKFFYLFLIFFVSQAASIFSADFIDAFLESFKDFLFVGTFFINSMFFFSNNVLRKKEKFSYLLFSISIINIAVQLLIFFNPSLFLKIFNNLLHSSYLSIIQMNIERGRIFFIAYDEVLIPILFYLALTKSKNHNKFPLFFLMMFLIFAVSFLSNFRTKFLMFLLAFFSSIFLYRRQIGKLLFLLTLIFLTAFFVFSNYSRATIGFNVVDRFLIADDLGNTESINYRKAQIKESFNIFLLKPFFGVGLGNYLFYSNKRQGVLSANNYKEVIEDMKNPHNIFLHLLAETGIFGLSTFLLIMFYFIKLDFQTFNQEDFLSNSIIISFWTLFVFSLLNPTLNLSYNILFWYLRFAIYF